MTNWREVKLGELISIKHGYAFKGDDITTDDNGIVLVTPGNFAIGGGFQEEKCKFFKGIYPEDYVLKENDLIVTMTDLSKECDTLGYGALVPGGNRIYLHNQRIGLVEFKSQLISKNYLYWFMRTKKYQHFVVSSCSGSVIKHTSPSRICDAIIPLPPMDIQKKIAGVLGALDDKIELNNKINNNLEQQAQALIQEHINNLKTIVPLDEFCNVFTGRKNANEFEAGGVNKFFTCGPEALTINSFIYDGPAVIISGNGAYTGRTRFYNGKFDLYQRTYACTLKEQINGNYIYLLYPLLKMVLEKKLMGGTHGSAIPYIVMNDIAKFEVPFEKEVFDRISPACKTLVDKIQFNEQENEKLAAIRDALLPKLMKGEIDVSNVDISALTSTDKLSFRCRSPHPRIYHIVSPVIFLLIRSFMTFSFGNL